MRIAVLSPHTRQSGVTALSMLIALEVSQGGKKTCLTHLKSTSKSFFKYFNLVDYDDITSSPSQIVKLLKEGGLDEDGISDYCRKITEDLEVFTNNATNFSEEDMEYMFDYIGNYFPHENIVVDVDSDNPEKIKKAIGLCDIAVMVVTQSVIEAESFLENREEILGILGKTPTITVINKFNSIKGTLNATANWMGIKKPNKWLVMHENPWVAWATNQGKVTQLFKKASEKYIDVVEIESDLKKIHNMLIKYKVSTKKKV